MHQLIAWQMEVSETNPLPPFKVLGIQIATARGQQTAVDNSRLIRKMARRLKLRLKDRLRRLGAELNPDRSGDRDTERQKVEIIADQPDWKVTVYPVAQDSAGTIAILKSSAEDSCQLSEEDQWMNQEPISIALHYVSIWISGAYDWKHSRRVAGAVEEAVAVRLILHPFYDYASPTQHLTEPEPMDYAFDQDPDSSRHGNDDLMDCDFDEDSNLDEDSDSFQHGMDDPQSASYDFQDPDSMNCDVDEGENTDWAAFSQAQITYPIEGTYLVSEVEKTVTDLFEEKDREDKTDASAQKPLWMKPDASQKVSCNSVPWSREGSLIGLANGGKSPVLMMQASNGAMICSFPNPGWEAFVKKRGRKTKSELYIMDIEEFIDAFEAELKRFMETRTLKGDGEGKADFNVFGTQLWADRLAPSITEDLLQRMEKILAEVVPAKPGSDLSIRP